MTEGQIKTLMELWLELIEETERPHLKYFDSGEFVLKLRHEAYSRREEPVHTNIMRAFIHAVEYKLPIPEWVIDGLDSDERLKKYRPWFAQLGMEWMNSDGVITRWNINDVTLVDYILNRDLGYYIKSGKWMSKAAQVIRQKGIIKHNGWTWVDAGEITDEKLRNNLDDLVFSKNDIVAFEEEYNLTDKPIRCGNSITQNSTEKKSE